MPLLQPHAETGLGGRRYAPALGPCPTTGNDDPDLTDYATKTPGEREPVGLYRDKEDLSCRAVFTFLLLTDFSSVLVWCPTGRCSLPTRSPGLDWD